MSILTEYSLTPDVFDSASYSVPDIGDLRLQNLKEVLISEGIVRDLRNGKWSALFADNARSWHQRGKELLKKLAQQNRFYKSDPALSDEPGTDQEWCKEALASNVDLPFTGIISTQDIVQGFQDEPFVASIERLSNTPWWSSRSPSVRLLRSISEYKEKLSLVLRCANSISFLDPHLDPTQGRYRDFISLLTEMSGRIPKPLIEVHRVCYYNTRDKRDQNNENGWRNLFDSWKMPLLNAGISVNVTIWDDFHDRYVISNLVGISVPNGFDTTTDPNGVTTWSRLGRKERDDIQREFDPAAKKHRPMHSFQIPLESD